MNTQTNLDARISLIYELDGHPVREDGTFAEFMRPDATGRPRLISLLETLDRRREPFFLAPAREVFPGDFSTGEIPKVNL